MLKCPLNHRLKMPVEVSPAFVQAMGNSPDCYGIPHPKCWLLVGHIFHLISWSPSSIHQSCSPRLVKLWNSCLSRGCANVAKPWPWARSVVDVHSRPRYSNAGSMKKISRNYTARLGDCLYKTCTTKEFQPINAQRINYLITHQNISKMVQLSP